MSLSYKFFLFSIITLLLSFSIPKNQLSACDLLHIADGETVHISGEDVESAPNPLFENLGPGNLEITVTLVGPNGEPLIGEVTLKPGESVGDPAPPGFTVERMDLKAVGDAVDVSLCRDFIG